LWIGSLQAFRTTGKRPAFRLVSRPYRIGYNALAVLVLVMMLPLPPLSSLDPLLSLFAQVRQAFRLGFVLYSVVKVLFVFTASSSHKKRLSDILK
jgi:hypothetical protein